MTAAITPQAAARPLALVTSEAADGGDRLERERGLVRPEFLGEVWDAGDQVFAPPRSHPLLGLRKCAVIDCEAGVRTPNADLCKLCIEVFKTSGLTMEQFAAIPTGKMSKQEQFCRVAGCLRPSNMRVLLCLTHFKRWKRTDLSPQEFAGSPKATPLTSLGECAVVSCSRGSAFSAGRLCSIHQARWARLAKESDAAPDFRGWLRVAEPINLDHLVVFKGLAERVQLELLLGLQVRTDAKVRTLVTALRPVVAVLRAAEAQRLADLDISALKPTRRDAIVLAEYLVTAVRRAITTPGEECRKDVWDLAVLGLSRRLDFTPVSQVWLRQSAKRWAAEALLRHRGRQAAKVPRDTVAVLGELSACLRETRPDRGDDPTALSRRDIVVFLNRLAHHECRHDQRQEAGPGLPRRPPLPRRHQGDGHD